MKGCSTWSYQPYRPLLYDTGEPYICRVVPDETSIHLEWIGDKTGAYSVFYRERGTGTYSEQRVFGVEYSITGLRPESEYEVYVQGEVGRSRVRLGRTGRYVGTVVNYLHPEDDAYAFSGRYLCSPSLVRHPEGYLLASMDLFAGGHPQNLTLIFRSDDDGESWHYVSELMPCFWGKMFIHRNELYMLACSTEYGDLLIGKSTDGGKTFSAPVTLLRGANGKNGSCGVHKNPQNIFVHNGRIYETLEWGAWANTEYYHAAMVMSCDVNDDLLIPENWHFTPPVKYDPNWPGTVDGTASGTIEGTLCLSPEGILYNVMRYNIVSGTPSYGLVLAYRVNTDDPDAPLEYSHSIEMPCNHSKFMIKLDPVSKKYYSVATRIDCEARKNRRNLLSLLCSDDMRSWRVVCDVIDKRDADMETVGFQYVDFEFEGDDIIFLCRTAINGAHSFHDSNCSTFHRIKGFRSIKGETQ